MPNRKRLALDRIWDDQLDNLNSQLVQLVRQLDRYQALGRDHPEEAPEKLSVHARVPQGTARQNERRLRLVAAALGRLGPLVQESNLFAWWQAALDVLARLNVIRINKSGQLTDYFYVQPLHESEQTSIVNSVLQLWAPAITRRVLTLFAVSLPGEVLDLQYLHEIIILVDDPRDVVSVYDKSALVRSSIQDAEDDDWVETATERIHQALWRASQSPRLVPMMIISSRLDMVSPQIKANYTRVLRDPEQRLQAHSDPYGHLADFVRQNIDTELESDFAGYFTAPKRRIRAPDLRSILS